MTEYWLSEAAQTLRTQVDNRWPKRSKASDGWIGDSSHAASKSDHNPCWTCVGKAYGVVRALDIDGSMGGKAGYNTTDQAWALANQLRKAMIAGDNRISYIIAYDPDDNQSKICSMNTSYTPLGRWRDYTGASHINHIHVSFTPAGDFRGRKFDLPIFTNAKRNKARAAVAAAKIALRKAKNKLAQARRRLRKVTR